MNEEQKKAFIDSRRHCGQALRHEKKAGKCRNCAHNLAPSGQSCEYQCMGVSEIEDKGKAVIACEDYEEKVQPYKIDFTNSTIIETKSAACQAGRLGRA